MWDPQQKRAQFNCTEPFGTMYVIITDGKYMKHISLPNVESDRFLLCRDIPVGQELSGEDLARHQQFLKAKEEGAA